VLVPEPRHGVDHDATGASVDAVRGKPNEPVSVNTSSIGLDETGGDDCRSIPDRADARDDRLGVRAKRVLGETAKMSIDEHGEILTEIDSILGGLLQAVGASRVTLRQDMPGDYAFPVTYEALAPGVASLVDERTVDLRDQPVVRELKRGNQVVQNDCRTAFDDAAFQQMLATYGGLAAQVVTPIVVSDRLCAILSLHQLGTPRSWTDADVAACTSTANRVAQLL
jgi:GAF domain-containing protein